MSSDNRGRESFAESAMRLADTANDSRETASDSRPLSFLSFGLRLAVWYATLFVVGSIAILFLTYFFTAASLAQRDDQAIRAKLGELAAAY